MSSIRQKCRPRHQVLVLKCYPKLQKNAVDVIPNPSELNYLLYYTSTRRSKIQKVGDFLEKRTINDVYKRQLGNVQVTLQILTALVEKSPRDLPLYAQCILRILKTILGSYDLTMVENSLPTFDTFCAHHDGASLTANQEYIEQYSAVVRLYASFAAGELQGAKNNNVSAPVRLRWRKAGLQALKSIASSEALGTEVGRQYKVIMPVILQNLYADNDEHFIVLQQRSQTRGLVEPEKPSRRKMSIVAVRNTEASEASLTPLLKTTADADKLAEEDIGILALESLKKIFASDSRSQTRTATTFVLEFIIRKTEARKSIDGGSARDGHTGAWATTLVETIARWAPVQDRYIIVSGIMEMLIRGPTDEQNMQQQLTLASLVSWLLSSNVNLIGLSVMDVLLGLVNHILRLLRLGGPFASGGGLTAGSNANSRRGSTNGDIENEKPDVSEEAPSKARTKLLERLQNCVGNLATHIYYSDQISDMIRAILLRLKPSPMSTVATTASAIENPESAAQVISDSAGLYDSSYSHDFFSFATARVTALNAIREILNTANSKNIGVGTSAVGRNRVGVDVWEGTQWLLSDVEGRVRVAYVDALLTWLRREVVKADLRIPEETTSQPKSKKRGRADDVDLVKRATSNASHREKSPRPRTSTFLQLLNLAIYQNATQLAETEPDVLLLHALLTNLTEKLGVNSVKSTLPMIVRLQEDIQELESPTAKVNVGSLVHGYFWALSEKFDFEASAVGREIQAEIARRRSKGLWVLKVRLPPGGVEQIDMSDLSPSQQLNWEVFETESLRPFDGRTPMVDRIANAYSLSLASPPSSAPNSPGRVFSMPLFGTSQASNPMEAPELQLPLPVREQMLSDWSKESVIATIEKETAKTASLSGSRNGTTHSRTYNQHLTVHPANTNGTTPLPSGAATPNLYPNQDSRPASLGHNLATTASPALKHPLPISDPGTHTPGSTSSRTSTLRVDDLKRVLTTRHPLSPSLHKKPYPHRFSAHATHNSPLTRNGSRPDFSTLDGSSDSMVSAAGLSAAGEGSDSASFHDARAQHEARDYAYDERREEELGNGAVNHRSDGEGMPPVPGSSLDLPGGFPSERSSSVAVGGGKTVSGGVGHAGTGTVKVDIQSFLGGIRSGDDRGGEVGGNRGGDVGEEGTKSSRVGGGRPPY